MKITTKAGITINFDQLTRDLHSEALATRPGETSEYPIGFLEGCQVQIVVTRDDDRLLDPAPGYTCLYQ